MTPGKPGGAPAGESLWAILDSAAARRAAWENERSETARQDLGYGWKVHITCPGSDFGRSSARPGTWDRCTPTVLDMDTGIEGNHIAYRGACLGCGWVSHTVHFIGHQGENGAAEDANDHTHPGWRELPIVGAVPYNDGGAAHKKAIESWRRRWEPILPPGWLNAGGPIRTQRRKGGTRHVPERAPGGGYDMSADDEQPEMPGGQRAMF